MGHTCERSNLPLMGIGTIDVGATGSWADSGSIDVTTIDGTIGVTFVTAAKRVQDLYAAAGVPICIFRTSPGVAAAQ